MNSETCCGRRAQERGDLPKLEGRTHVRKGKIAYIQTQPGPHLGEYLVRFDCLTLEQVQELVKYQPLRGLWVNHLPKPFGEEALLEALSVIKRPV